MAKRTTLPEPDPEPTVYIQLRLPAALHQQLKIQAAMDAMSLKDTVIAAIESYVGWT